MIIFLYGEDTYRSQKKVQEIIDRYKNIHKSGLNLRFFDAKEGIFKDFKDQFKITSMFGEKKLIIIKNFFSEKDFQNNFIRQIDVFLKSEDVIVIYEKGDVDKRNKNFKLLTKKTQRQEFKFLKDKELKRWVEREFERYQTNISDQALQTLVGYTENDLWRLSNEIRKLVSFKNKEKVSEKDVKLLVKPKIETDIFKTIDAIAKKDKKTALNLIDKHLSKGDSPLYILSMINFQFRNLLIVKDFIEHYRPYNVILKKSGLHPFVVKKSYSQSQKFSMAELKKIYHEIFKVDYEIKTGKVDPRLALEAFIAKI